jgi:hypothetical protein
MTQARPRGLHVEAASSADSWMRLMKLASRRGARFTALAGVPRRGLYPVWAWSTEARLLILSSAL